jgi:eukaryotic-like serine/threonine-protein kinase
MSPDTNQSLELPLGLPDRYRVKRHIASGGMASVWCAEDLVLSRNVAVKVLSERFANDHVAVLRFKREARAAARVSNHRHVVTVYDVGELEPSLGADATRETGGAFIVMEFLAGGTVADAIRYDSVRRHEAMRWLAEAASALDHAHARGIVHRDIKPANFLLDRGRTLHVADFGIAHLSTEDTITTSDQLFGTAAYLSPEQALGREATGASDRYALAVAAFELLAGQRPFSAPHFSAQARQHIEEPPPAASEIDHTLPPAVDEVLFDGLAKDAADRPETAGAFVAALDDALRGNWPADRAGRPRRARMPDPAAPAASTAAARLRERTAPSTRPPTSRMSAESRPAHGRRVIAFGALVLAALVVTGIAVATMHGGKGRSRGSSRLADRPATTASHHSRPAHPASTRASHARTTTTSASTTTQTQTAANLETTGHEDIAAGDYTTAIPILKQAIAVAPHDSTTYAYALYDLGNAEVLSGDPQAAIPVLRERLQIDNQRGAVRSLLDRALQQTGQTETTSGSGGAPAGTTSTTSTTPTAPAPGAGPGSGTGSGGAGLPGAGDGGAGNGDTVPAQTNQEIPAAPHSGHSATHQQHARRWWRHHRHHHHGGFSLLVAAIG